MGMNVSGFGKMAAEKLAAKKSSGKGGAGGPHQWSKEIHEYLTAAIAVGEVSGGSDVTCDAILAGLHANGIAPHIKSANAIGDAMGMGHKSKALGLMRIRPGVYRIPYKMPSWNGEKWVGADYQPPIVLDAQGQAMVDDMIKLADQTSEVTK